MLIRTSGVKRFSDFLLWQVHFWSYCFARLSRLFTSLTQYAPVLQQADDTQIYFTDVYWPEFGLWEFIPILFDYQRKVWAGALGAHRQNKAVAATAAATVM